VILFSLAIGLIFRLFWKTKDLAFQSLWLLFAMNVYLAGLVGTLLSNGFILVLFLAVFVRFENALPHDSPLPARARGLQARYP
jgi:hypothetical protein